MIGRFKKMLGLARSNASHKPDPIRGELVRAVQANERASHNAQRALEALLEDKEKMRESIGGIVGKM